MLACRPLDGLNAGPHGRPAETCRRRRCAGTAGAGSWRPELAGLRCGCHTRPFGERRFVSSIRVIIAKPGLDGHDRGAKVVASALQEDADAIGLSILSGAHMAQFSRVLELLKEADANDITVFGGGIIPSAGIVDLERMGVAKIFTPGATTQEIVEWVRGTLGPPAQTRAS